MPLSDDEIRTAVARYKRERDRYVKLAELVADVCRSDIVEANAIRAQVTSRAKGVKSLDTKLRRPDMRESESMQSAEHVFLRVGDLAGVRVATYRAEDQDRVVKEIAKRFVGPGGVAVAVDRKDRLGRDGRGYYRATHCQVFLNENDLVGSYENLDDVSCEIQVCSMMAHVWNEIEHDIGYKPEGSGPLADEARMLAALGHLTRSGDEVISQLLDATLSRLQEQTGDFQDVFDFAARLRPVFPGVDLSLHAGQIYDEIQSLGFDSPEKLKRAIGEDRFTAETAHASLDSFNKFLQDYNKGDFTLEVSSSDLLLVLLLDRYADQILMNHPAGRGLGRPPRIRSLATRYLEYVRQIGAST